MSPPVPGTLWREATSSSEDQPLIIDGHVIPPGTQVSVSIYSLHHNEEYFPDSFEFQSERWFASTKSNRASQAAFTPFSIGSRGCAGKSMAYLETSLVLSKAIWYFDFELASSMAETEAGAQVSKIGQSRMSQNEFPIKDLFAASHAGPMLVFKPRDRFCDELVKS